jgi:hypothetical protein
VEELAISTSTNLINSSRLEIDEYTAGDMFTTSSLRGQSVECIITTTHCLIGGHLTIGLRVVLEAVELPAIISDLNTSLTNMDRNHSTHIEEWRSGGEREEEEEIEKKYIKAEGERRRNLSNVREKENVRIEGAMSGGWLKKTRCPPLLQPPPLVSHISIVPQTSL